MLRDLLLVLNMLVCLALIGVVLLQRSEGGAFGTGSPTGLVTARGAGDLLTRTTWVLFTLFLSLSLALTLLGGRERSSQAILQRLKSVTVNPDQLATPTPAANTAAPATAPAQSPAHAAPPPLQLPPLEAAPPKPHATHANKTAPVTQPAPSDQSSAPAPALATPEPLALPPLPSPTNSQTKPPSS
jgi:preprotein translocase subunit SecG